MVTRINGAPRQGVWFSADVRFVSVTINTGTVDFEADLTVTATDPRQADVVNSDLEQVIEILQTRGTVIGMTVAAGGQSANFMVDYAQALDPDSVTLGNQSAVDVTAEIEAAIEAKANVTAATVAVQQGFAPLALGTPS